MIRIRHGLGAVCLGATLLVACSSGEGDSVPASTLVSQRETTTTAAVATSAPTGEGSAVETTLTASSGVADAADAPASADRQPVQLAADIDPDNVLTAAVLVVTEGDVDAALASGAFSEEELSAALDAIEQGTLSDFVGG
jgi:hypothetical protein